MKRRQRIDALNRKGRLHTCTLPTVLIRCNILHTIVHTIGIRVLGRNLDEDSGCSGLMAIEYGADHQDEVQGLSLPLDTGI